MGRTTGGEDAGAGSVGEAESAHLEGLLELEALVVGDGANNNSNALLGGEGALGAVLIRGLASREGGGGGGLEVAVEAKERHDGAVDLRIE